MNDEFYDDKRIITAKGESTLFEVGTVSKIHRINGGATEIILKLSYPSRNEQSSQYEAWRVTQKYGDEAYKTLNEGMTIAVIGNRRSTREYRFSEKTMTSTHYCVAEHIDILSTKKLKGASLRNEMSNIDELLRKATGDEEE